MFAKRLALVVVGLSLALSGLAWAEDAPAGKVIEDKCTPSSASKINFAAALGLDLPSAANLGQRIDAAWAASDPVALASAAKELGAYEKVAGKTAQLKSEELAKAAATLASLRMVSAELRTVAQLISDEKAAKGLMGIAEKAAKAEAAAKAAKESGAKSRGIMGRLHVDNRTNSWVRVYIDGRDVGVVAPLGDGWVNVGQGAYETTYLDARDISVGGTWHHEVTGAVNDFTWNLYP